MSPEIANEAQKTLGIIGFGAFGQLIAQYANGYFELLAYDPSTNLRDAAVDFGVSLTSLDAVGRCDVVVIASPVSSFESIVNSVAAVCRAGALIIDVGSVKVQPSDIMKKLLPSSVDVVATHPLFGPQSARDGIQGLKIAVCPIRGRRHLNLAAFLRRHFGLRVIMTTPHEHDREAATVQGLTHLIAKVLQNMGPLPSRMTTRSFDLLVESISMVQNDAPEVFEAIENANPYAPNVRHQFFKLAYELNAVLNEGSKS